MAAERPHMLLDLHKMVAAHSTLVMGLVLPMVHPHIFLGVVFIKTLFLALIAVQHQQKFVLELQTLVIGVVTYNENQSI